MTDIATDQFLRYLADLLHTLNAKSQYEEVLHLIENTDLKGALGSADGLRQAIGGKMFTSQCITSTVSIGVATSPASGRTCDALIIAAKKALFEAQRAGRDNVFSFEAEHSAKSVL